MARLLLKKIKQFKLFTKKVITKKKIKKKMFQILLHIVVLLQRIFHHEYMKILPTFLHKPLWFIVLRLYIFFLLKTYCSS